MNNYQNTRLVLALPQQRKLVELKKALSNCYSNDIVKSFALCALQNTTSPRHFVLDCFEIFGHMVDAPLIALLGVTHTDSDQWYVIEKSLLDFYKEFLRPIDAVLGAPSWYTLAGVVGPHPFNGVCVDLYHTPKETSVHYPFGYNAGRLRQAQPR